MSGGFAQAQVVALDAANLSRIHPVSAASVFWEVDPLAPGFYTSDSAIDKSLWLTRRALEQATVGFSIVAAGVSSGALATVLYCPAEEAPGAVRMPTAPVSKDAWLVSSLHIDPPRRHSGWESVLLDSAIMAATGAGAEALEVFGVRRTGEASSAAEKIRRHAHSIGLVEVSLLEGAGFEVHQDHPVIPRLRLRLPPAHDLLSAQEIDELLAKSPLA
ncbi:hypothetical protein [Corynebacterium mayonis]|uniref:hypothetical protein n=1 Tax=Corynebacterium mayonis TaxID=3062461 RepID=UPI00313FFBFF